MQFQLDEGISGDFKTTKPACSVFSLCSLDTFLIFLELYLKLSSCFIVTSCERSSKT